MVEFAASPVAVVDGDATSSVDELVSGEEEAALALCAVPYAVAEVEEACCRHWTCRASEKSRCVRAKTSLSGGWPVTKEAYLVLYS